MRAQEPHFIVGEIAVENDMGPVIGCRRHDQLEQNQTTETEQRQTSEKRPREQPGKIHEEIRSTSVASI